MVLTLTRCEDVALHALGGLGSLPSATSTKEIVNAAGQWLLDANAWSWSQRLSSLSTVADQGYVSLSSLLNFRKLYRAIYSSGTAEYMEQCDLGYIQALRAGVANLGGRPQYVAVGFDQDQSTGVISYRLELYPTPADAVSDAVSIWWGAGFSVPGTAIPVPPQIEPLFLEIVREMARAVHNLDDSKGPRLNAIVQSAEWQAAVRADAATQQNYGQIRGSAIQPPGMDLVSRWMTGTVPNP